MSLEGLFLLAAVSGGVVFAIRILMLFASIGGDMDGHADLGHHVDAEIGEDVEHASADMSFKVLSLQGVSAFFLMFGLGGLALLRQSGAGNVVSLAGGVAAGLVSTWVIAQLFRGASKLQSSGTLDMSQAVGATGSVYLNIDAGKPGKVTITVQGRLLTLDATAERKLETGAPIRVVRVVNDNLVAVEKL